MGEKGLERYREGGGAGTAGVPSLSAAKFFSSPPVPFKVRSAEIFFLRSAPGGGTFRILFTFKQFAKGGYMALAVCCGHFVAADFRF